MADTSHPGRVSPAPGSPDHLRDSRAGDAWHAGSGRVISLISRKGGVGKTTSAVNLGAALALSGHRALVIGTDPQCGVCRSLGVQPDDLPVSLTDLFDCGEPLADLVQKSPLPDLHFVSPRVLTLEDEERFLRAMELRADEFVAEVERMRALYDTILIDCPPSLGPATRAALMASDSYLVPVQAEEFCRESLASLLEFVDEFRAREFLHKGNPGARPAARLASTPLELEGLFLTMASERTRMGRYVAARVAEDHGDVLCRSAVPRTTRLAEMALRGKPAVIYDRRSAGSRAYFDLADELVSRYCRSRESGTVAEPRPAWSEPEPAAFEDARQDALCEGLAVSGMDRFLIELAGGRATSFVASAHAEPPMPEMVSLDELLAEEEPRTCATDEWDGYWSPDVDRMN